MPMQLGLFGQHNFDEQKRLNRLTVLGDRLPRLNEIINWETSVRNSKKSLRPSLKNMEGAHDTISF